MGSTKSHYPGVWILAGWLVTFALIGPVIVKLGWLDGSAATINIALGITGFVTGFRPAIRPIQTIWFAFQVSWLGIAPVELVANNLTVWGDGGVWGHPQALHTAFVLNALSTAVSLGAFALARRRPVSARRDALSTPVRVLPWIGYCYLGLAVVLGARLVSIVGGPAGLFSSRSAYGSALGAVGISQQSAGGATSGLYFILPSALAGAAALLLISDWHQRRARGEATPALRLFAVLVAISLAFVLANPWSNPRQRTLAVLGSIVLAIWRPRTRREGIVLGLIALIVVLVIYPLGHVLQGQSLHSALGAQEFDTPDFDGFQQWVNTVLYVSSEGHTGGSTTLSAIFYFIPRSIWASKSIPASILVASHAGYTFTNLSMPFQAEMYLEFGPFGMCAALALVCYFLGRCDSHWVAGVRGRLTVLVPFLAPAVFLLIRGALGSNVPLPLTVLILVILGLRARPPSRGTGLASADLRAEPAS